MNAFDQFSLSLSLQVLSNVGENPKDRLLVQSENPLTEAMSQYVEKGVTDAIGDYVNRQIENMAAKLEKRLTLSTISKEGITEDIAELAGTSRVVVDNLICYDHARRNKI